MTEYVPGNFMWSQGVMFAMEMMTWGGAAAGEVLGVMDRLSRREQESRAWWEEWSAEAERLERWGDAEAEAGHALTAGSLYLRAATYYFCGERFLPPGDDKRATYERVLRCFARGTAARYPNLERVEVPYQGTSLPAYFLRSDEAGDEPAPTMVVFDGLDNAKELSVFFAGVELGRRGVHTLAIDGPGQGETLRLRGIPSRYDYEVPGTAAYEYVAARSEVDPARVGVMGFSLGGYYAPRAATFEKRYALCVAWGGHFDYHEAWVERRKRIESADSRVSAPGFQRSTHGAPGYGDVNGPIGVLKTGALIYAGKDYANGEIPFLSVSEGPTLDVCYGHAGPSCEYHQHAISKDSRCQKECVFRECELIGYIADGFPLYSQCAKLTSCYVPRDVR